MGAYLNQQTAFSHPLWPVVTYSHTLAHKYTPSLAEASDIHSHTGRHPLSFENPQSPFTLQNPHTPRPVCLGTLHQRTHAPAYTDTHTYSHRLGRTHFTEGPSPYCLSIWLVTFVSHFLSVTDENLLGAGGAAGTRHASLVLPCWNRMWWLKI